MNRRRALLKAALAAGIFDLVAARAGAAAEHPGGDKEVIDSWFGVKGDGVTNDRVALQRAIDNAVGVGKTLVITGKSRVDVTGLTVRTGSRIRFANGASIKFLPHDEDTYQVLRLWDVQNVIIENANVDGSKELNSARGGENGIGISVVGSSNVTLTNPITINCWGDGIYIAGSYAKKLPYAENIKVTNHHASGCRRQGVSIISAKTVLFDHPVWTDIQGTAPSAGLDIEPDHNSDIIENVRIVSPYTRNCTVGILVWLKLIAGPEPRNVSIEITNHHDEMSRDAAFSVSGLRLHGNKVTGRIASISPVWDRPRGKGFLSYEQDDGGPQIVVADPKTIR
jgi:parallel beta-helix repeat protein